MSILPWFLVDFTPTVEGILHLDQCPAHCRDNWRLFKNKSLLPSACPYLKSMTRCFDVYSCTIKISNKHAVPGNYLMPIRSSPSLICREIIFSRIESRSPLCRHADSSSALPFFLTVIVRGASLSTTFVNKLLVLRETLWEVIDPLGGEAW